MNNKNNSVFNALLKTKEQLVSSISKQNKNLERLTKTMFCESAEDIAQAISEPIAEFIVTTNTLEAVMISKAEDVDLITFSIDNGNGVVQSVSKQFSTINEYAEDKIFENHDFCWNDILISLSEGAGINEAITKVNELFLTTPNVSISDINTVLQTCNTANQTDISILRTEISEMVYEGKVSNWTWATCVSKLMEQGKEATGGANPTFEVKSETFFRLQTFMETVLNIASVILDVVFTALQYIFQGLGLLFAGLYKAIQYVFSSTFNTDWKYDVKAIYPGIRGTTYAGKIDHAWFGYGSILGDPEHPFNNDQIYSLLDGSIDTYTFKMSNSSTPLIQQQFILKYNPRKFMYYIAKFFESSGTITEEGAPGLKYYYFKANTDLISYLENAVLDLEDYMSFEGDVDFLRMSVTCSVAVGWLSRIAALRGLNGVIPSGSSSGDLGNFKIARLIDNSSVGKGSFAKVLSLVQHAHEKLYNYAKWQDVDNADVDWILQQSGTKNLSDLQKLATDFQTTGFQTSDNLFDYEYGVFGNEYNGLLNCLGDYTLITHSNLGTSGESSTQLGNDVTYYCGLVYPMYFYQDESRFEDACYWLTTNEGIEVFESDCIQTANCVSIPSTTTESVIAALALVAGVAVAATLFTKKIGRALAAKKQVKQTDRLRKLNTLKKAWDEDPGNDQAKDNFEQAIKDYQKKALFFGWGTYDAANGWLNPPAVASSASSHYKDVIDEVSNFTKVDDQVLSIRELITHQD